MSRGGRGGFRGGGGAGGGGRGKMGGVDLPWEYDPDLEIKREPSELFPQTTIPYAPPPRRSEKIEVARYRSLRARIHEGPLYTVLGASARIGKSAPPPAAVFDPFEGMPTYAQKYKKQRRRMPRLDSRPYVLRFFPEELHALLDPDHNKTNGANTSKKRKRLKIAQATRSRYEEFDEDEEGGREDDDDEEEGKEDDEDQMEEEVDDDYEDDEDDADDYNAEQYFDNGEDDVDFGDNDMGGGGEDWY